MRARQISSSDSLTQDTSTSLAPAVIGNGGIPTGLRVQKNVNPATASTAVVAAIMGAAVHTGAASTGHNVGVFGLVDNASANALTAMYAMEGRIHHTGAGTTGQTASFIAAAQTTLEGAVGTITAHIDFLSPAFTNVSHMNSRFSWVNQDANKGSLTEGYLNVKGALRQKDRDVNGCTAWVAFDASGGTPTIRGSFNVTSITDGGVGAYTMNLTTALTGSSDKAVIASGGGATLTVACLDANKSSNTAFNIYTYSLLSLTISDGPVSAAVFGGLV